MQGCGNCQVILAATTPRCHLNFNYEINQYKEMLVLIFKQIVGLKRGCWCIQTYCFIKKFQLACLLPHPKEILLVVWERIWPLLGIFPGLSMPSHLGESSLTSLLASRICICTSSCPKDDVMGFQRLSWDHTGLGDALLCVRTWAVWALLGNSECVALDCPLASHELTKSTLWKQGSWWRDSIAEPLVGLWPLNLRTSNWLMLADLKFYKLPDAVIQFIFCRQMAFR